MKKGEKIFICIYHSENGNDKPLYLPYVGFFDLNMTYAQFRRNMINYYSNINYIKQKFGDLNTNNDINIDFYTILIKNNKGVLFFDQKKFLDTKQNKNLYLRDLTKNYSTKNILILISNK